MGMERGRIWVIVNTVRKTKREDGGKGRRRRRARFPPAHITNNNGSGTQPRFKEIGADLGKKRHQKTNNGKSFSWARETFHPGVNWIETAIEGFPSRTIPTDKPTLKQGKSCRNRIFLAWPQSLFQVTSWRRVTGNVGVSTECSTLGVPLISSKVDDSGFHISDVNLNFSNPQSRFLRRLLKATTP